ncbi:MAG: hypothetical protein A2X49_00585 [Lentisphaerae bacterium GWF2_52_8]|nr:MAG: hypothetical protein A2X49_00585 [Lentisphaerae bacterium GWF2_52_8]
MDSQRNKEKIADDSRYSSYEDYLRHQSQKTLDPERRKKWLGQEWEPKLLYFEKHFKKVTDSFPLMAHARAIALGARTGQEVEAMRKTGFDAIGIDIVPCPPLVLQGDIHKIPFPDNHFKFAFSNIFDHALYPKTFVSEIRRVLAPGGLALLHLQFDQTDEYGVTEISNPREVANLFETDKVLWNGPMSPDPTIAMDWELLLQINKEQV